MARCMRAVSVQTRVEETHLNFSLQTVLVYNSAEEHLTVVPGTTVHWLGGECPPDVPVCGFKNDNPACLTSQWTNVFPCTKST